MQLTREMQIRLADERAAAGVPDGQDLVIDIAFASELPYERWWGVEILDCSPGAARLARINDGGALLFNHDWDRHLGHHVAGSARMDADRIGRAKVVVSWDEDDGRTIRKIEKGHITKTSVGYQIHRVIEQTTSKSGEPIAREVPGHVFQRVLTRCQRETPGDLAAFRRALDAQAGQFDRADNASATYRVTDWEVLENSLVTVPADTSVGVGREAERQEAQQHTPEPEPAKEIRTMDNQTPDINVAEIEQRGAEAANKRAAAIIETGEKYGLQSLAAEAVRSGMSVADFNGRAIEALSTRTKTSADIGLTDKEAKRFSFIRAIAALSATGADARKARDAAAFEIECSQAVAGKIGREARGIFVPNEVQHRDLVVGTPTAGGNVVSTDLLAQSFIDLLRNKMSVMRAGSQMLTGLNGNIALPRMTGAATAYWVTEGNAPTESQQAFDQVTMSPKTVGAFTDISRKLLLQSSIDVEGLVRSDLATVLGLEIDRVALNGSGTAPQPRGVLNTVGIGSVAGGTAGAAPTWANIVSLWSAVAAANADYGTTGFVTNSKVVGKLMTTEKATGSGQFVCPGFPDAAGITNFGGARAVVSNQVPSNLVKGGSGTVCSAIAFGNWADLIIGMWGTLDLMVDPYSQSTSGTVRVVALQDVDVAVRHAESFAAMLDALTA